MIGKVCRRGGDTRRLLYYLFTEGQVGERGLSSAHSDAHVIGGYDRATTLEPARAGEGRASVGRLAALLDAPVRAAGVPASSKPVYHLAISAAPGDRLLSDEEWSDVAAEHLERIGLTHRPSSAEDDEGRGVRWVAVRHAPDHIHVVATLVTQQGRRVWPRNDFYRAREASLAVERRFGLTRTSPADRTGDRETTCAEQRRHAEQTRRRLERGVPPQVGPDRDVLRSKVRAALAGSSDFDELVERLGRDGVLVRPRMSTLDPEQVTGYAVALRSRGGDAAQDVLPVWFGGGKLAPDLTYPQLLSRWGDGDSDKGSGKGADQSGKGTGKGADQSGKNTGKGWSAKQRLQMTDLERRRLWVAATQAATAADAQLRAAVGGDPAVTAQAEAAARSAGELLASLGPLVERYQLGPLRHAADAYDRAARTLRRGTPRATDVSRRNRRAAGGLRALAVMGPADRTSAVRLAESLIRLCRALAELREAQDRHAQAAAARRAAELLAVAPALAPVTASNAAQPRRDRAQPPAWSLPLTSPSVRSSDPMSRPPGGPVRR